MRYAYYPGCSSEHLSSAYRSSVEQVADFFRLEFTEIPDWNCCGATEYMSIDRLGAYSLAARNLALVPEDLNQVVAYCSACYLNLRNTDKIMSEHHDINNDVSSALSAGKLNYTPGRLDIRHILDVFINDIGLDVIKEKTVSPLTHLRVAPYYGCMLVRPTKGFDHPEYPETMDMLFSALGATVVDFSMRAYCCGGHMPHIKAAMGFEIIRRILKDAHDKKADVIAVACPVCQLNLDAHQEDVNKKFSTNFNIPVLFFTQIMGLAFGMSPGSLEFGKEIISAERILSGKTETAALDRPKKNKTESGLPMPEMKGGSRR
jgi:heterodisulfide reductase subunit B